MLGRYDNILTHTTDFTVFIKFVMCAALVVHKQKLEA